MLLLILELPLDDLLLITLALLFLPLLVEFQELLMLSRRELIIFFHNPATAILLTTKTWEDFVRLIKSVIECQFFTLLYIPDSLKPDLFLIIDDCLTVRIAAVIDEPSFITLLGSINVVGFIERENPELAIITMLLTSFLRNLFRKQFTLILDDTRAFRNIPDGKGAFTSNS